MAAKKKPLDAKSLADFGVTPSPLVKQVAVELPPPRPPGRKVESVADLVKKLRDEAKAL
jgi:electron transfer flavoprotein beta subunit